jgi:formylglycine-generating enzyme required for sulfatase activity
MTIGANVAGINGNWTGGTVGSGYLFAGHNDNSPTSACAAPSNDTDFYVETNCTAVSSGDTAEQRRTLTLSNSNVIWDLSGNVWEWVNYMNAWNKPGATSAWYEYTAVTGTTTTALKDLVPTNAVKAFWSDAWNSGKSIGQYYPGVTDSGGALLRGGQWNTDLNAGVFAARLDFAPTGAYNFIGFRCVSAPSP